MEAYEIFQQLFTLRIKHGDLDHAEPCGERHFGVCLKYAILWHFCHRVAGTRINFRLNLDYYNLWPIKIRLNKCLKVKNFHFVSKITLNLGDILCDGVRWPGIFFQERSREQWHLTKIRNELSLWVSVKQNKTKQNKQQTWSFQPAHFQKDQCNNLDNFSFINWKLILVISFVLECWGVKSEMLIYDLSKRYKDTSYTYPTVDRIANPNRALHSCIILGRY